MRAVKSALLALVLFCASASYADVAVPPIGRVVDQTATLSSNDISTLEQKLKDFEDRKGSQVAVLIVPTTAPEAIEQYSLRVVEQWKLGRKKVDDGALLIIAKDDRKLRIEVGYGLEGVLNDATSKRIIDEVITPKFRSGDFSGGISDGVDKILSVIDGEPLPAPQKRESQTRSQSIDYDWLGNAWPFLFIGTLVVGGIFRAIFGRLLGALIAGGIVGALAWFALYVFPVAAISAIIVFVLTMFGDSIASGSGGGGSGGGFSSGSSGGGFSGGGGSFGGGGASGSW